MLTKVIIATLFALQACGALKLPALLHPRITDGNEAAPGEFPYQVSIIWGIPSTKPFQHNCGGSILNERYVLTAGHCIMSYGTMKVVVGRHSIKHPNPEFEQILDIDEVFVHEMYGGGATEYDIALLKLKQPIIYNKRVAPLVLPGQDQVQTGNAVLSGWGSISKRMDPVYPDILQKANVTLVDNEKCTNALNAIMAGTSQEVYIYSTQICSGPLDETISACSGDSGGPLVQFDDGIPVQVGIVSFGLYPCGNIPAPSVYTRVASYVDWIHKHMIHT